MSVVIKVLATNAGPAPSGALVFPVLCVDDAGHEAVHIFSSRERQLAFCRQDLARNHVLWDYVLDFPERLEKVPH